MAETRAHAIHYGIAEQGKLHALAHRHGEALRHYREALRLSRSAGAPDIFFRHYTQCVLESLELSGDYEPVIDYCRKADAHYVTLALTSPLHRRDHGALLERLGVVLARAGRPAEAAEALARAIAVADPGAVPLAEEVAGWLSRRLALSPARLTEAARRHRYFVVRADQVDRAIARPLPPESASPGTLPNARRSAWPTMTV